MAEAPRLLAMAEALAHSSSLTLPSAFGAREGSLICPYFSCLHTAALHILFCQGVGKSALGGQGGELDLPILLLPAHSSIAKSSCGV